jgi:hypothetical protein
MVLFVGEVPEEAELLVWDLFFVKGSYVVFRVALTVMELMQKEVLKLDRFDDILMLLTTFCQTISRKVLADNLATGLESTNIAMLRHQYRQ